MDKLFKPEAKTFIAIAVGTAVFFLLGRFTAITLFTNTYLAPQYGVLALISTVYGPVAGLFTGFAGHLLVDVSYGAVSWTWVGVSAAVGCAGGFILNRDAPVNTAASGGLYDTRSAIRFLVGMMTVHLTGWGLLAPALDVLVYAEPAAVVFTQGWIAGIANTVTAAVLGTVLLAVHGRYGAPGR